MELIRLIELALTTPRRAHAFEAVRRIREEHPASAEAEFERLLSDPTTSDRAKAIVLYHLREFNVYPALVAKHLPPLRSLVDAIVRDV